MNEADDRRDQRDETQGRSLENQTASLQKQPRQQTTSTHYVPRSVYNYEILCEINPETSGEVYLGDELDPISRRWHVLKRATKGGKRDMPRQYQEYLTLKKLGKERNIVELVGCMMTVSGAHLLSVTVVLDSCFCDLHDAVYSPYAAVAWSMDYKRCLIQQILRGLDYIHSHYLVHRNLSLKNILLSNKGLVKIADFYWAGDFRKPLIEPHVGTKGYQSPEVLLGTRVYAPASDIWSIGLVFQEVFTGERFMKGDTYIEQILHIFEYFGPIDSNTMQYLRHLPLINAIDFPNQSPHRVNTYYDCCVNKQQMDELAVELLRKLLHLNPAERIPPSQALKHSFLNQPVKFGWPRFKEGAVEITDRAPFRYTVGILDSFPVRKMTYKIDKNDVADRLENSETRPAMNHGTRPHQPGRNLSFLEWMNEARFLKDPDEERRDLIRRAMRFVNNYQLDLWENPDQYPLELLTFFPIDGDVKVFRRESDGRNTPSVITLPARRRCRVDRLLDKNDGDGNDINEDTKDDGKNDTKDDDDDDNDDDDNDDNDNGGGNNSDDDDGGEMDGDDNDAISGDDNAEDDNGDDDGDDGDGYDVDGDETQHISCAPDVPCADVNKSALNSASAFDHVPRSRLESSTRRAILGAGYYSQSDAVAANADATTNGAEGDYARNGAITPINQVTDALRISCQRHNPYINMPQFHVPQSNSQQISYPLINILQSGNPQIDVPHLILLPQITAGGRMASNSFVLPGGLPTTRLLPSVSQRQQLNVLPSHFFIPSFLPATQSDFQSILSVIPQRPSGVAEVNPFECPQSVAEITHFMGQQGPSGIAEIKPFVCQQCVAEMNPFVGEHGSSGVAGMMNLFVSPQRFSNIAEVNISCTRLVESRATINLRLPSYQPLPPQWITNQPPKASLPCYPATNQAFNYLALQRNSQAELQPGGNQGERNELLGILQILQATLVANDQSGPQADEQINALAVLLTEFIAMSQGQFPDSSPFDDLS